jgi:hypothetical protein
LYALEENYVSANAKLTQEYVVSNILCQREYVTRFPSIVT